MKNITALFLLFYISASFANVLSDEEVKLLGRSLANYQICGDISVEMGDPVMLSYYRDMYNDGLLKRNTYPKNKLEMVIAEQQNSATKLARIDRKSLEELCLSRFDLLSRKIQENKLAGK